MEFEGSTHRASLESYYASYATCMYSCHVFIYVHLSVQISQYFKVHVEQFFIVMDIIMITTTII